MKCIEVAIHREERIGVIPELDYTSLDGSVVAPTDWEASVDGETWKPGADAGGQPVWYVADAEYPGPNDNSDPALTDFTVTAPRTTMKFRIIDGPITEILEIEIKRLA